MTIDTLHTPLLRNVDQISQVASVLLIMLPDFIISVDHQSQSHNLQTAATLSIKKTVFCHCTWLLMFQFECSVCRCLGLTGEEIKLHDSGEEVCSSTDNKRTEDTETAVSGEYHLHYQTSTSKESQTLSISVVQKICLQKQLQMICCSFTHNSGIKQSRQ